MEPPSKKYQIAELPYEIWNQILLRLPTKTVIALKSVCKNWRNIINSHDFQVSHVDCWRDSVIASEVIAIYPFRSAPELLSLDLAGDDIPSNVRSGPLISFEKFFRRSQRRQSDFPTPAMKTTVLHCCDGLFLVAVGRWKHVFLCNTLTNSYLALPLPKKGFTDQMYGWTIVYDPSTRGYVIFYIGCNFVSKIQVVFALRVELNGVCHGRKSPNNWRQLWSSETLTLRNLEFLESISVIGKAHWLFRFQEQDDDYVYETGVLTIDATTEESIVTKCSTTPTPGSFFQSNKKFYCLKESSNSSREAELWAIDDVDNPTWLKHHAIIQNDLETGYFCRYSVLLKEGNRLIMRFMYSNDMFIYDISLKKWHFLDFIDSDGNRNWWSRSAELMSIHFSLLRWN